MTAPRKPKLAVWKFASCDGCQLSIINCENELLSLAKELEISYFLEISSAVDPGPYDISIIEGSIATPHDAERIRKVREVSKVLIAVGACATAGGPQGLRNFADAREMLASVYPHPEQLEVSSMSTSIAENVSVDFELQGCPFNNRQFIEVVSAFLHGRSPVIPTYSVCMECKRRGTICLLVAQNKPCMGPVTHAGCGALCPAYSRACYGCYGPKETTNTGSLATWFRGLGMSDAELVRAFRTVNAWREPFRKESYVREHSGDKAKPEP